MTNVWRDNLDLIVRGASGMAHEDRSSGDWPLDGFADDLRRPWRQELAKRPVALVTIVALEGGGPRPVGTQMVVSEERAAGFLSGGCIEGDVTFQARQCLTHWESRRLVYGRGSPWFDIKLLCGARIELLVEPVAQDDPAALALFRLTDERSPARWITDGTRRVSEMAGHAAAPWQGAFIRHYDPLPRLVVVGRDPTALAIASLGIQSGFETYLVRPKGPAEPPPFAGLNYVRATPERFLTAAFIDPWTAVATCSHDEDIDVEVLHMALPSTAHYVGLLGSRRRTPGIQKRLLDLGVTEQQLARLRAPIGLDIGGKAPFEIAVSVIGEIIADRSRKAHGRPLRQ